MTNIMQNISNVAFVGFMGCGKTSVSKELSHRLNRRRISSDEWISNKSGKSIPEIFADHGESFFRQKESEFLNSIKPNLSLIIDCGGGLFLNPENVKALKEVACVIYLSASLDFLYDQIKGDSNRPLLKAENPYQTCQTLLDQRTPFYMQAHKEVVSEGRTVDEITEQVINILDYDR